MEKVLVNPLCKGQTVESIFLVKEKIVNKTKSGSPYLSIRLIDRTGEVEGRIWDNALDFVSLFDREDFVRVRADTDEFQGVLQLRIMKLKKCSESEVRLEDFLPKTAKNVESMFAELQAIASRVAQPPLRKLLESILGDHDWVSKFKCAPAAKAVHHVYLGGLLEHTLSVAQLAALIAPRYPAVNQDLLLTGAILHDLGKISELTFERNFDYTDSGRLMGHIILTVEMVEKKIQSIPDFPPNMALLLKHLILSHHGEYEFGSPKLPMTLEALLLHHIDDLDAKMSSFAGWIEKEKEGSSRWTSFFKLFDRFLYKPETPPAQPEL